MSPRNITWEEEVDDKIRAINKKRLELRIHFYDNDRLREQLEFSRNLLYRFVVKITQIEEKERLGLTDVSSEIREIRQELLKMETDIDELTTRIRISTRKGTELSQELYNMNQELRQFIGQNVQAN